MTQYKTPFSDGVSALTQYLISNNPGNNTPDKSGTYWYHGHHQLHYTDGIYGAFIVLDKNERQTYAAHMEKMGDMMFADWYGEDGH